MPFVWSNKFKLQSAVRTETVTEDVVEIPEIVEESGADAIVDAIVEGIAQAIGILQRPPTPVPEPVEELFLGETVDVTEQDVEIPEETE